MGRAMGRAMARVEEAQEVQEAQEAQSICAIVASWAVRTDAIRL